MNQQQRRDLYLEEMGLGQRWLLRSRDESADASLPSAVPAHAAALAAGAAVAGAEAEAVVVSADWMLIGAPAPGSAVDSTADGVGPAGQLLQAMLQAIDLKAPRDVRLSMINTLINKEISQCRPRLIVALGASAAQTLLATEAGIDSLRGQVHRCQDVPLIVTYHPADLLRTPMDKAKAWEDLLLARRTMQELTGAG